MVIKFKLAAVLALFFGSLLLQVSPSLDEKKGWDLVDPILDGIKETSFPDRQYNILDYGAVPDVKQLSTEAIEKAILDCAEQGGGTVLIPPHTFYTGAIRLYSNVNLYLEKGATLKFSTDPADYLPLVKTRWEGVDCYNYSPLIYAVDAKNIAITGKGVLDGQANNHYWWPWKGRTEYGWQEGTPSQNDPAGREQLFEYMDNNTPVDKRIMGEKGYLRPPFIQLIHCQRVLIENIRLQNSPFWLIHPLLSEDIIIRGVYAESYGPNNDGCDPESCKNVLIENCHFDTGDDCIAIKSGRNGDGRRWNVPSENIVIRNCEMKNGHGGVVIGSEISGGCKNIFVEDCLINSPELERAIRIKTNSFRGGTIENVYVRNITVGEVKEAILKINCLYETEDGENGDHPPLVKNIYLENIRSDRSKYAFYFQGLNKQNVIHEVYIRNCCFNGVENSFVIENAEQPVLHEVYINGKLLNFSRK